MAKAKGKRALTKAEQQQRVRARVRIINEEMEKVGLKRMAAFMPPVYLQAMMAYEESFHTEQNLVKTLVYGSSWLCSAIEKFVKEGAEAMPDSKLAQLYHSDAWVSRDSIDFNSAVMNATVEICRFEDEHEKELK